MVARRLLVVGLLGGFAVVVAACSSSPAPSAAPPGTAIPLASRPDPLSPSSTVDVSPLPLNGPGSVPDSPLGTAKGKADATTTTAAAPASGDRPGIRAALLRIAMQKAAEAKAAAAKPKPKAAPKGGH